MKIKKNGSTAPNLNEVDSGMQIPATVEEENVPASGQTELAQAPIEKKKGNGLIDQTEHFLRERYDFRFNLVSKRAEYKRKDESIYVEMDDFKENSILRELMKAEIKCSLHLLQKILHSDFCTRYDPFLEYLGSLPEYDGQTDYIAQMANTVTTGNPDFWVRAFKKWIVASVATLMRPGVTNHSVIIFTGAQGIGKTTWMENLVPPSLRRYVFSGTINPRNKDTMLHLSECWFINLDELDNMNKHDLSLLKEIVTKTHIRVRRAYGHHNEKYVRRASFMGSVNSGQFLTDTTGNRRWLCFEVTDIQYEHGVDINMVYTQCLYHLHNDFQYWFTPAEIAEIETNNEQFQEKSVEEELLLTFFEAVNPSEATNCYTATSLLARICEREPRQGAKCTAVTLGKVLKKHNFTRLKRRGLYTWAVKERNISEIIASSQVPESNLEISIETESGNSEGSSDEPDG
jgi:predicted P-loop ATPase